MGKRLIPKVTSLYDLRVKAKEDPRYERLAVTAAKNLGGGGHAPGIDTLEGAMKWLYLNANETSEEGVVGEVNYVRDMV